MSRSQSAHPAVASQVDCSKASSVAGGLYRFYEINPQVVDLAQQEFTFTRDSQASIETRLGNARLLLEKETSNNFDVLAVDAFSGGLDSDAPDHPRGDDDLPTSHQ